MGIGASGTSLVKIGRAPRAPQAIKVSPRLVQASDSETDQVLEILATAHCGLSEEEAASRLEKSGPNVVTSEAQHGWVALLRKAILNPLVILLTLLAVISYATGDLRAAIVMMAMVFLGVTLRFFQEVRA